MASYPCRSAVRAIARLFGQLTSWRPSTVVIAQPLLTLTPNRPSLSLLSLNNGLSARRVSSSGDDLDIKSSLRSISTLDGHLALLSTSAATPGVRAVLNPARADRPRPPARCDRAAHAPPSMARAQGRRCRSRRAAAERRERPGARSDDRRRRWRSGPLRPRSPQ